MGVTIDNSFAVAILVASIEVSSLCPAPTAIKTLNEKYLRWHTVAEHLTEEVNALKEGRRSEISLAAVAQDTCQVCGKEGHTAATCFMNPLHVQNKL